MTADSTPDTFQRQQYIIPHLSEHRIEEKMFHVYFYVEAVLKNHHHIPYHVYIQKLVFLFFSPPIADWYMKNDIDENKACRSVLGFTT